MVEEVLDHRLCDLERPSLGHQTRKTYQAKGGSSLEEKGHHFSILSVAGNGHRNRSCARCP